jgi:hypothetical protein
MGGGPWGRSAMCIGKHCGRMRLSDGADSAGSMRISCSKVTMFDDIVMREDHLL